MRSYFYYVWILFLSQVNDDNEYVCSRGKGNKKNLAMLFLPLKLLLLVVITVLCMMQNHLVLLSWYFLWVISSPVCDWLMAL